MCPGKHISNQNSTKDKIKQTGRLEAAYIGAANLLFRHTVYFKLHHF